MTTDQIETLIYNIQADIIIGKNLKKHLSDIYKALEKLDFYIRIAKINNEVTAERETLRDELLKWGKLALAQLKEQQSSQY